LTFTPGGAGLAGLTNITVRLTNSAVDAVSGKAMYAPYELKFATAAFSLHDTSPPAVLIQAPTNGAWWPATSSLPDGADNVAVTSVEVQLDGGPG